VTLARRNASGAPAAEKVLHVLAAFEITPRWTLAALAEHLGLPKSTLHRLLGSLRAMQFVVQDPADTSYHLGPRVYGLANRARDFDTLADAAMPTLRALVAETGETAFMTVRDGLHSLCVARVNTPKGVRLLIDVGTASPLHLGASNTVLLAFLPEVERSMILSQTVLQPRERQRAEAEMRDIVGDGFAYSSSQLTPGAAAIGVPIVASDGTVIACLSVGAPAYRFARDHALTFLPALRRAAHAIGRRTGHIRPMSA
jgi:IclR family transcriptional regulator, acetate operon repressor